MIKDTILTRDELLVLVIEECGEVIQAATKCLRFGYSTMGPAAYGRNSVKLASEIGELFAVVDCLPLDINAVHCARKAKIPRAETAKRQYQPGG